MIATVPPLWRDADAYVQLTQDPKVATFWGHAPAYCYVAKVPLLIGEQWERMRGLPPVPRVIESQPALTDSGIWLLIVAQHLGLGLAAFLFINAVSQHFWTRLVLSLVWASNALFYTFAHCVGSETLGMILLVLLAASSVRLVQNPNEPAWHEWYLFAILLLLCILSRDLNLALFPLLPATFLISGTWCLIVRRKRGSAAASLFRLAVIATAVSTAAIVVAHSIPNALARKTRLHPHSRIGYTFLWRLHFLTELPEESRADLLRKASARASSEEVRQLIRLLEHMMLEQTDPIEPTAFVNRAIGIYGGSLHWEDLDAGLKQMEFGFLWPPSPELLRVIKSDFITGTELPSTVITEYLFATTAYYFQHAKELPGLAKVSTFRNEVNGDKILALPSQHPYFHLWQGITYRGAVAIWTVAFMVFLVLARREGLLAVVTAALAVLFVAVGLFQFSTVCVLSIYQPRFALSMWELLLFSFFLLIGTTFELFFEKEKSAGQLLGPEP
jgi:hypothetical protein